MSLIYLHTAFFVLALDQNREAHSLLVSVSASPKQSASFVGTGNIASHFEEAFIVSKRAFLFCFPHSSLADSDVFFDCHAPDFSVGETRSVGLGICIALLNLSRLLEGKMVFHDTVSTGILSLNGNVFPGLFDEEKKKIISKNSRFVGAEDVQHLSQLPAFLYGV